MPGSAPEPAGDRFRRAHLLPDPSKRPPKRTFKDRIRSVFKRGRVITASIVAVMIAIVGLANASFDLWGRTLGSKSDAADDVRMDFETSGPDADVFSGDQQAWSDDYSQCLDNMSGEPIGPAREPYGDETFAPGDDQVGFDSAYQYRSLPGVWVHDEPIEIPEDEWIRDFSFLEEVGALRDGPQSVRIYVANQSDEPLLITEMTLQVERRDVPSSTIVALIGGDYVPTTFLLFDLSQTDPVARDCGTYEPFFQSYAIEVAPGAAEVMEVEIYGGGCWCLVRTELKYWHQGDWGTALFPDEDHDPISVVDATNTDFDIVYAGIPTTEGAQFDRYDCSADPVPYCGPDFN